MMRDPRRPSGRPPSSSHADIIDRRLTACALVFLLSAALCAASDPNQGISKAASDVCSKKVQKLQEFAPDRGRRLTTRLSQDEVNSFLALELSSKYSPGLKSLLFTFEEAKLQGEAVIDFDILGMRASKLISKLMAMMLSGTHRLNVRGKLISKSGKANFQLEEARFDNTALPNFIVEEIITAVGRKQRPPFDPVQPSQMPYHIDRVEVHPGYIRIYQ